MYRYKKVGISLVCNVRALHKRNLYIGCSCEYDLYLRIFVINHRSKQLRYIHVYILLLRLTSQRTRVNAAMSRVNDNGERLLLALFLCNSLWHIEHKEQHRNYKSCKKSVHSHKGICWFWCNKSRKISSFYCNEVDFG